MAQDILSNGFVRLCIDPSLNFYDGACRVLIVGQGLDTGSNDFIPDSIQQVNNERDLGDMFGRGSVLSEALRRVLCQCPNNVQLFAVGLADPSGEDDVAAVYTSTITGPATSDGRFTLFLGEGDYNIDVSVKAGDTAAAIATRVAAAVSLDFPYVATAVGATVVWTARNVGEIGNFLNPIYNWSGRRNYAPGGVTFTTVRTTEGVGVPVMPNLIDLAGECCYSCVGYLGPDTENQDILQAYLDDAWDCSKPQCFGHGYVYNVGTLGQVLATGNNAAVLSRLAYALNSYDLPYLTLAAFVAKSCCTACSNPELSIQGPENGRLDCIRIPQSCTSPWTFDERTQLQDAGFVTYGPSGFGTGAMTNPQIFNDVTNYLVDELGRQNVTFRDASSRRLAAATALSVAEKLNTYNGLALFTKNTKINQGVKGTNPRLILADLRAWAKANIGILFSEFENLDRDLTVKTDFEVADPCRGNPNWLWVFLQYMPPNRIGRINTNLVPKVLDNCNR
jgi:phage tail sheath gpL-like